MIYIKADPRTLGAIGLVILAVGFFVVAGIQWTQYSTQQACDEHLQNMTPRERLNFELDASLREKKPCQVLREGTNFEGGMAVVAGVLSLILAGGMIIRFDPLGVEK